MNQTKVGVMQKEMLPSTADVNQIKSYNQRAWDLSVLAENRWTVPVTSEQIGQARQGSINIVLTPKKVIPKSWLGDVQGKRVLALASGGGQQAPILAAAGAQVTVLDLSSKQLAQDKKVADREGLTLQLIQGSADNMHELDDQSFDLIINPVSNCFFPSLKPVWEECARVSKPGASLLVGFNNPVAYCFDFEKANQGEFIMRYPLPYSDLASLNEIEKRRFMRPECPLEFSHSLTDQLGGIMGSGFSLIDMYEDEFDTDEPINKFFPQFICVNAKRV